MYTTAVPITHLRRENQGVYALTGGPWRGNIVPLIQEVTSHKQTQILKMGIQRNLREVKTTFLELRRHTWIEYIF